MAAVYIFQTSGPILQNIDREITHEIIEKYWQPYNKYIYKRLASTYITLSHVVHVGLVKIMFHLYIKDTFYGDIVHADQMKTFQIM